jgi:hypothetical protein
MNWSDCMWIFEPDGSLRDLYFLNTDIKDWQRLIEFLRGSDYFCAFTINDKIVSLPIDVGSILEERDESPPSLHVDPESLNLHCHFFCTEEIEFDLDPSEVSDAKAFEKLVGFMIDIGDVLAKDVILTGENMQSNVLLRYDATLRKIVPG